MRTSSPGKISLPGVGKTTAPTLALLLVLLCLNYTSQSQNKVTIASGKWTSNIWSPPGIPSSAANITISPGHVVALDQNVMLNDLTIGGATGPNAALVLTGKNARTHTVTGNVVVYASDSLKVENNSNGKHTINFHGNITNNGIIDLAPDQNSFVISVFKKNGNQSVSGSGPRTRFHKMTIDAGTSRLNVVDISASGFTIVPENFLTLLDGTLKFSLPEMFTGTAYTTVASIPSSAGLWLSSPATSLNMTAGTILGGKITVDQGTLNAGTSVNAHLLSPSGTISVSGGLLRIGGILSPDIGGALVYSQAGGTVMTCVHGSTVTTNAPFDINSPGSAFSMSGGLLVISTGGVTGLGYRNTLPAGSVTGGTLQIGHTGTPAGQTIGIQSGSVAAGNLAITGSIRAELQSDLHVLDGVAINAGTLSAANNTLSLGGNWNNTGGRFLGGNGQVVMNGAATQSIGGSFASDFNDLLLTNGAGAVITDPENVRGSLSLQSGILNTNGLLTIVATPTSTGRIGEISGTGDINGAVNLQAYAPGGATGWALLGAPMSSSLSFSAWDDDFAISCPACPDGFSGGFYSIWSYDETQPGRMDTSTAYVPVSQISDPISPDKAYWVYLGNGYYQTTGIPVDISGEVRKFQNVIPLDYTNYGNAGEDGWNLVPNPYPSPISWAALRGGTPGIDDAIYIYNADLNGGAGTHAAYVNGISSPALGSGGIGDAIPMFQGFYVHSTGATSLVAQENIKVRTDQPLLRTSSVTKPVVRLSLKGPGGFKDETVLYFQNGASRKFDPEFDAYKLNGTDPNAPSISLEHEGLSFQVNGVAPTPGTLKTTLKAASGYSGSYTISAADISIEEGRCILLQDPESVTDLRYTDYVFYHSGNTPVVKFDLFVKPASACGKQKQENEESGRTANDPEGLSVRTTADNVYYIEKDLPGPATMTFRLYDIYGRLVKDYGTLYDNRMSLQADLGALPQGVYIMQIVQVSAGAGHSAPETVKLIVR